MTARLYTIAEAADRLGMSFSWLEKQVAAHAVPTTRFGRSVRFSDENIAEIIAAHQDRPATPPAVNRLGLTRSAGRVNAAQSPAKDAHDPQATARRGVPARPAKTPGPAAVPRGGGAGPQRTTA